VLGGAIYAGCGSDDGSTFSGSPDAGSGDAFGGPDVTFDTGGSCSTSAQCDGGAACVNGACCASASVCGSTCCGAGTVCLFNACVTPGKPCHTANDCGPGEYCEPSLGGGNNNDAGVHDSGADGAVCTQGSPPDGRCLPIPPVCGADAGSGDGGCVATCEYHPPSGGTLNAVAKWTWGPVAQTKPDFTDVWSTPTIGRVYDSNCDGKVDELDSPDIIFVSGRGIDATTNLGTCCQCTNTTPTACHTGVLRMLDGRTGQEIWSLDKASAASSGFAGMTIAIGDIDGDQRIDILAVTGEGYVVMIDANGKVVRTSDKPIPGNAATSFGWGGGLAIADIDLDGFPEIAFGATVFMTTNNAITLKWTGANGIGGGGVDQALSTFVDLDGAAGNHLELLAGNCAYKSDGTPLWNCAGTTLPDGFSGVGDFNKDGKPEAVLVSGGKVWILDGATGNIVLGPATLPGTGQGGAPTVADFDGDGFPEIGVAMATFYSVMKPNFTTKTIDVLWSKANHDLSSSVTGSTVFDFEGDGRAEVIYGDECFLWVFDGKTGNVRFAAPHTSFTGTEASLLADVDGDGHAEMVMVSNGADPSNAGWKCLDAAGNPAVVNNTTWVPSNAPGKAYRGITVFGDKANSWVGTRTLWTEHTYHVTNICDDRDTACAAPNVYGSIPKGTLPWLNDFRQNVQDKGIFNAPDAIVALAVDCSSPLVARVAVRNIGMASLPAGVNVGVYVVATPADMQIATTKTTHALYPGQTETLNVTLPASASSNGSYYAKILIDPNNITFHECRTDNDQSDTVKPICTR
jgi:hypothetical protein